jgi:hypothetical protein
VIDQGRDAGVDPGQFLAGRDARGAGGDDLLSVPRARLHAALHATGAHPIGQVESLALLVGHTRRDTCRNPARSHARQQLFSDLGDESVEFRMRHEDTFLAYCCSMSMIFWTRA